jgi:hypothetical protein
MDRVAKQRNDHNICAYKKGTSSISNVKLLEKVMPGNFDYKAPWEEAIS